MNTTRRARYFAALAATTLALSACGGGGDDDSSDPDSSKTSTSQSETQEESSSEEEQGSETEQEDPSESESPEESSESAESESAEETAASDASTVTATKSGVTFQVPQGWEGVNPSEVLGSGKTPQSIKDMAEAQGMDPDTFLQQISQSVDVMVVGPTKNNFADNVNVIKQPGMPSTATQEAQLEQIGATVSGTEQVDTPLGTAQDTTYTLPADGTTVQGRSLGVPTADGAVAITVSSTDAAEADKVATQILESIDKA